jgi:RNA polymerase sigma-70 factor (ECF subfamily)
MADRHDGSEPRQTQSLPDLMTTIELLDRYKGGDDAAMSLLLERSLPPLRRWARGRLPQWARSTAETNDLIQNAVIRALPHLKSFEVRHPGALQAYLRQAISNHIRDEIRRVKTHPAPTELDDAIPDDVPSPLERAIGRQGFERYEAALQRLRPADREAIVARIELQQSYEEVAIALGKPSADAARMAVTRAIRNLLTVMAGLG